MAALLLVVAVLGAHNVVGNLVVPSELYVPVNLAVAAVLLVVARGGGVSWEQVGLGRSNVGRGARVGAVAFLVVAVVLVVAAAIPATRPFFEDDRAADLSGAAVAYHALVRIPLGTVALEEIAFRGVLLALLERVASTGVAAAWSSALFGLWHVVPTVEALRTNDLDPGFVPVATAVAVTAAGGLAFCWLRLRGGSLVAPALAHVATNSVALVIAVAVLSATPAAS